MILDFDSAETGVQIDLRSSGLLSFRSDLKVNLANTASVVQVIGSKHDDTIWNNNFTEVIEAGSGDDVVYGGNHDEMINGDYGNDTIFGGGGDDDSVWRLGR